MSDERRSVRSDGRSFRRSLFGGLSRLEKRGLIRVARFAVAREVTIVASGKSTAPHTGDRTPHWRLRGVVPQPRAEIEASPVVVSLVPEIAPSTLPDRPCFRCESRGWCGHDGRVAA